MTKDTLKTIGAWCAFFGIIAIAVFGIRSCEIKEKAERDAKRAQVDYDYQQELLNDEYVYQDINGVYHITRYCNILNDVYWEEGEDEDDEAVYNRGNYSSQYISRNTINDWHLFAATHQLCSECFTPDLIRQLDSVRNENTPPYMREKGKLSSPLEKQYIETDDEMYRDADEEYYNITQQ